MSDAAAALRPLAVIVPVYRNAETLEELADRVRASLADAVPDYRLLFVVDASPDASWSIIRKLSEQDPRNLGLMLERNVGQHRALLAGIAHVQAEYYAILDADLQDPPELLGALLARARIRNESVFALREGGYQSWERMLSSRIFKGLLGLWIGLPANAGTYLMIPRDVAKSMLGLVTRHAHVAVMARRLSGAWSFLPYRRDTRKWGRSAYSFGGRCKAAWCAISCAWACRMLSLSRKIST